MTDRVGVSEWEYEWVIKPHTYITQTHPHGQTKSAVGVVNVVVNAINFFFKKRFVDSFRSSKCSS